MDKNLKRFHELRGKLDYICDMDIGQSSGLISDCLKFLMDDWFDGLRKTEAAKWWEMKSVIEAEED